MSDVETRLGRIERILEISRSLISTVSLESLLHKTVEAAVELTGSEMASILLLDDRTGELRFTASSVLPAQLIDISVPIEGSLAGEVLSSGEPLIILDVHNDPRYRPKIEQPTDVEAHSLLAVTLEFEGQRLGVLEVANKCDDGRFGQVDVDVLTVLASQAAAAIRSARLVETLREEHDLAEALRQASAALSSTLSYDAVLDRILEQISHVMPQVAANIMLVEGPEVVRVFRGHGYEQLGVTAASTPISLNVADVAGLRRMQQTGQPEVIPYVERDEEWVVSRPEHAWIKSYAGAPICSRDQVLGFLNVNSATEGFFSQADAERLQAFANHAAIAIENARLYDQAQQELGERVRAEEELRQHRDHLEETVSERTEELERVIRQLEREVAERIRAEVALQHRNQELAALNAVAQALSASLELQAILDQALLRTVDALGFSGGLIALPDERSGELVLSGHTGLSQAMKEYVQDSGIGGMLCDLLQWEGEPVCVDGLKGDGSEDAGALSTVGIRSCVCVPVAYQDRAPGALCLFDTVIHPISETDRTLLTAIGQQIGVAVENARLFRDAVRERQVSHILLDTAQALSTTLRLDRLLERALDELQRVMPYDAASISMVRDERCWTVASRGVEVIGLKGFTLEERPLVQRVVRERGPVIIPDVREEPDWSPVEGFGLVRSWLGVPLTAKDIVVGVLMMSSRHVSTYDKEAARPAVAFAHQVALALENSRLYEQVQARLRETNLLHSVTTALSYTLDLDRVLPYVARSLCEVLSATGVRIYGLEEGPDGSLQLASVAVTAEYVADEDVDEKRRLALSRTYALSDLAAAADVLAKRQPMQARVDDPRVEPHLQDLLEAQAMQAVLLLPMVVGDRVLGFAQVEESRTPRRFTEGEIATGQMLIQQAAVTVDNARLVEALRQRTGELQARNEELDAFAHTVAHDLKSPLNWLIGFSYLLQQKMGEVSEEEAQDDLRMIEQSGYKMNAIINELLLLASVRKIEEVEMEPLAMSRIVAEAQRRLGSMIEEYQAEIVVADDWPIPLGRDQWVEEVWVNYISNALKYGGQPPVVELGASEQEDGAVRFWVRDNGRGLTLEEQARLFAPFTRLDEVRAKGHGLGLSIVRRIVEKMDGQVGLESEVGQGSTFSFTLPPA